jgi:hypothetical protein
VSPPIELSLAAFGDDICLAYTRKNLLRGGPVELACNKIDYHESSPIFTTDPALGLLRKAMVGLAVTYFGSEHHETSITARGYMQYGEVLQNLNATLAVSESQTTNETLLTALTCMLLEIFLPTGPANFLKHQRGIEAIMCIRGPPTRTTGETATIFRGLRIVSIVSALVESRPSLYARADWKHAPVAVTTEIGLLQHDIFTILAECSQLTSDCAASVTPGIDLNNHASLLARTRTAMTALEALYPVWELINAAECTCYITQCVSASSKSASLWTPH